MSEPKSRLAPDLSFADPSYAVLYEVRTGTLVRMAELTSHRSQVLSAASDGEWIVWMEADDDPLFFDWHLRAYNISSQRVKEIARAARHEGTAVPGPISFVTASHGLAVWGQAIGEGAGPNQMANAVVRKADLATGKTETMATSAGMPWLSWPWLAWAVSENSSGYMHVVNLESGVTRRLDITPPQFVIHDASAVYNDPASLSMWLLDDIGTLEPAVEIARGTNAADHLEWPTLNGRIVAWTQSLSSVVFDRAQERLVALPVPGGWSVLTVAGPLLVWREPESSGATSEIGRPEWLVLVDTSDLPVVP
jgi:hypothetical protein